MRINSLSIRSRIAIGATALLVAVGAISAAPAEAFTSSNTATVGGTTYYVKAYSCNSYWSSCSWNSKATISKSKYWSHYTYLKTNGINVSLNISKSPGISITGNGTKNATLHDTGTGRSSYMSGVAQVSPFSVSFSAYSRLYSGGQKISSGWTTW